MLMIVEAKNVGPNERRWWASSFADACNAVVNEGIRSADDLHTDPYVEGGADLDDPPTHAIVDRVYPSSERPTNEHAPEMVWRQAFNAALTGLAAPDGGVIDSTDKWSVAVVGLASKVADAALEVWKKRWQR